MLRERHTLIIRWLHWINFPILSLMLWSGVLIYWAHQPYIKIPREMAQDLHIQYRLAEGMGWHFFLMWPYTINGLCYLIYLGISGQWREIFPEKKSYKDALHVIAHDFKLKKTRPSQSGKYNAAQKLAYTSAILMGIGSLLTGLAIYKPVSLGFLTFVLGGYETARFLHFLLTVGFVIFFFIHVLQVLRSGWNNFRSMIAGYEIEK